MATILIVEDDKNTQLLTAARLKPHFHVVCANDGLEALDKLHTQSIDLVIADVMMPRMDGYSLLKTLRAEQRHTPVLLLTAKQSFEDKREGFSAGTDDYMTKPIDYEELMWRINALLRRSQIASERKIVIGSIAVDSAAYSVIMDGKTIELPKKEFELLFKLLSYPNMIFTRNQLLNDIWGFDSESGEDTIKTHISRLRNKLKDCKEFEVVTIKGLGYKAEIREGRKP
ncbi:MAG: DNA-binding response regulator [Paenibacillaceae bacterium]|jgi:DNA-binding response OmpR family regulator|nr:DNA-binding response regulator [Paenibacillaceae bacterium]